MGTIYLVRHGQASFDSADYDNLSDLGQLRLRNWVPGSRPEKFACSAFSVAA